MISAANGLIDRLSDPGGGHTTGAVIREPAVCAKDGSAPDQDCAKVVTLSPVP